MKTLHNARWLAGEDIKRTWASYPATALAAAVAGGFITLYLNGIFFTGGQVTSGVASGFTLNSLFSDLLMVALAPGGLLVNMLLNPDLAPSFRLEDNFTRQLTFRRSLPLSGTTIVASRMLTLLANLPLTTPVFFLPIYLFFWRPAALDAAAFFWFALAWLGYALLAAGGYLYLWYAISKKTLNPLAVILPFGVFLLVTSLNLLSGIGLVGGSVGLAQSYGALFGAGCLLIGATGFTFCGRAAGRKLEKRDLPG